VWSGQRPGTFPGMATLERSKRASGGLAGAGVSRIVAIAEVAGSLRCVTPAHRRTEVVAGCAETADETLLTLAAESTAPALTDRARRKRAAFGFSQARTVGLACCRLALWIRRIAVRSHGADEAVARSGFTRAKQWAAVVEGAAIASLSKDSVAANAALNRLILQGCVFAASS
jgi:hypothetical protein